jgi:hypothetical protein
VAVFELRRRGLALMRVLTGLQLRWFLFLTKKVLLKAVEAIHISNFTTPTA